MFIFLFFYCYLFIFSPFYWSKTRFVIRFTCNQISLILIRFSVSPQRHASAPIQAAKAVDRGREEGRRLHGAASRRPQQPRGGGWTPGTPGITEILLFMLMWSFHLTFLVLFRLKRSLLWLKFDHEKVAWNTWNTDVRVSYSIAASVPPALIQRPANAASAASPQPRRSGPVQAPTTAFLCVIKSIRFTGPPGVFCRAAGPSYPPPAIIGSSSFCPWDCRCSSPKSGARGSTAKVTRSGSNWVNEDGGARRWCCCNVRCASYLSFSRDSFFPAHKFLQWACSQWWLSFLFRNCTTRGALQIPCQPKATQTFVFLRYFTHSLITVIIWSPLCPHSCRRHLQLYSFEGQILFVLFEIKMVSLMLFCLFIYWLFPLVSGQRQPRHPECEPADGSASCSGAAAHSDSSGESPPSLPASNKGNLLPFGDLSDLRFSKYISGAPICRVSCSWMSSCLSEGY